MKKNKTPADPKGVGQTTTRKGEDIKDQDGKEAGREDLGTMGATERPAGTSTNRDNTGIQPDDVHPNNAGGAPSGGGGKKPSYNDEE